MTLAAVLCCVMTTTVFTACTSEESHPNTYRYEVKLASDYYSYYYDEIQTVTAAFNQAVNYTQMLSSPQDNEMKSKCEAVKQKYANINCPYMKFNLFRYTTAVGMEGKEDLIATYEMGPALTTPYVKYAFVTNEEEAYAALEAKKPTLSDEVYKASYKTLSRLLGRHRGSSGGLKSAFENHFATSFNDYWPDTDENTRIIVLACDSIANAHAADTLVVDATVAVTKTGLFDQKVTTFWGRMFSPTIQ